MDAYSLVTSLLITLLAYGLGPLLFIPLRKKPISVGGLKWFCIIYTAVICLGFIAFHIQLDINATASGAPAFIWGTLFYHVAKRALMGRGLIIIEENDNDNAQSIDVNPIADSETVEETVVDCLECPSSFEENQNKDEPQECKEIVEIPKKQRFCKFCGGEIEITTKKCSKCGKQYFRLLRLKARFWIIVLLLTTLSLAGFSAYQFVAIKKLEVAAEENRREIVEQVAQISSLKSQIHSLENARSRLLEYANFMDDHIAIVPDDGSGLYHKYGCDDLDLSSFWAYNDAAVPQNYSACPNCTNRLSLWERTRQELEDKYGAPG